MATSTSLNLRALLKEAVARSGLDAPGQRFSGLTPSAKAMFVANAAHTLPRGVVLFVVPGDRDIEQAVRDVSFFMSAIEGLSDAATDRTVLSFPSHEVDPYRGMTPHVGVTSARARALHAIATGTARVVIASAPALLPRVSTPKRLLNASIELKPGNEIAPTDLGELLADAGFRREDPADEHGEFAVRGGILDVFPAHENEPVRLEFIGDTIETLRTYDPSTQRSIRPIDQLSIVPLNDVLGDDLDGSVFDYLAQARASRIIVSELEESLGALDKLAGQVARSYETATSRTPEPAEETWVDDGWDDDEEGVQPSSARPDVKIRTEGRRKVLTAPPVSRVDDLPAPRRDIRPRALRFTPTELRPPSELFVDLDAVKARLGTATMLVELGIDDDVSGAHADSGHIRCQPSIEFRGRVPDWVGEIKRLRQDGESVLFVANTPGRAERVVELLKEYDLFAVPVDRADDARYAAVLVATGVLSQGFRLPDAGLADLCRARRLRRRAAHGTSTLGEQGVSLRSARSQGRRSRRSRRPRHRCLHRTEADWRRRSAAGVPRAAVRGRRQAVRACRTARSGPEVHGCIASTDRPPWRHDVGAREDTRQEGHARHGRGAVEALRRAQSGAGPRVQPRLALAARIRRCLPVRSHRRSAGGYRRHQEGSSSRRRRWTGCFAATSATARPRSRCGRRSRR
ncbi:MAG: hypothetical protein QM736_06935 [Vicinamibacterales bacterium]